MRFDILTLFPQMMEAILSESIIGRARASGTITIECHNIRDYSSDKHRKVDDTPYGGGRGMLMAPDPIYNCYAAVTAGLGYKPHTVYLSPKGKVFTQETALRLRDEKHIVLLCGHYEGIDERIIEEIVDEEISIGDYVLTGGELPAAVIADSVSRLVPGVLPSGECYADESLFSGLLEYPQYTRPPVFHGRAVPEVLLSGNHAAIAAWRREQAIEITKKRRPDLLAEYDPEKEQP